MLGLVAGTFIVALALLILPTEAVKAYKANQKQVVIEQNTTNH